MSTPEAFDLYRSAWNAGDAGQVRALLERSVAADVLFVDPANTARGINELEALILKTHETMPNAQYNLVGGIDGHNQRYRYRWEVRMNAEQTIPGMDFVTVDADGRLLRIDGFFGDFASA